MDKSKFLKIGEIREITPPGLDGHRYRLSFEIGERQGELFHPIQQYSVDVDASRTLQSVWGSSDAEMASASTSSATSYALMLAGENRLGELKPLKLNTYTAPREPPQAPVVQAGSLLPIVEAPTASQAESFSLLSENVSDLRDHINTITKDMWGDRILLLSQERPLLDMYKPVRNADEFRVRVQPLGIIVKDVNKPVLAKVANVSDPDRMGPIVLLQKALETIMPAERASSIASVLKHINALRQAYPTHGDNAKLVLDAHRFFKLSYPVTDCEAAWESVLGAYFRSMRSMRDGFSEAWGHEK